MENRINISGESPNAAQSQQLKQSTDFSATKSVKFSSARTPDKVIRRTVLQAHGWILDVKVIQDALVPDLVPGNQADEPPYVRIRSARAARRRLRDLGRHHQDGNANERMVREKGRRTQQGLSIPRGTSGGWDVDGCSFLLREALLFALCFASLLSFYVTRGEGKENGVRTRAANSVRAARLTLSDGPKILVRDENFVLWVALVSF